MDPPYTESNLHSNDTGTAEHTQQASTDDNNSSQNLTQSSHTQNQQNEKRPSFISQQETQHQQNQPFQHTEFGRFQPQLPLNPVLPQHQYLQPQNYSNSQYDLQPRQQQIPQPPPPLSIPMTSGQTHLVPLQTPNYVPNTYQQQFSIQSPYTTTAQPPHFAQFSQNLSQSRGRHSFDSKLDDGHGNLLSYNYDKGSGSSVTSMHQHHHGGTYESGRQSFEYEGSKAGSINAHAYSAPTTRVSSSRGSTTTSTTPLEIGPLSANQRSIVSQCTRCKKDFVQVITVPDENDGNTNRGKSKVFKLCLHCRELQRQRSRRWQLKTKDKKGFCRRCATEIPFNEQRFVLCQNCRVNLRVRKASRVSQGRCIHCASSLSTENIPDEVLLDESSSVEDYDNSSPKQNSFRVCNKCRGRDKIRRYNLEQMGSCNRCTKTLTPENDGNFKVCADCRAKKKHYGQRDQSRTSQGGGASQPASLQSYASQHYTPYPQYSSQNSNNNPNFQLPFSSQPPVPYMQTAFLPQHFGSNTQPITHLQPPYSGQFQSSLPTISNQGAQSQPVTTQSQNQDQNHQQQSQSQNQNLLNQGQEHYGSTSNQYLERRA
ncbi:hypothetical protein I9W82_002556 [Candida metapsilosis]|uniref:Uncharacterized protein n=1 Tax=Candida metapsilosis TaxID=273372 RepID=A0A8H7ZJ64_9ASCO|nr:hypothetical protein I9W82_002556 [Candida metapsilosis]